MAQGYDIKGLAEKIRALRHNATELKEASGGIQAIDRNVDRILACITMLEISVNDVAEILGE